ncbi:MAG: murein biosynthesis integral membrane protein MurJ [Gammaproteobacteria bacterium]|nr:murein biosynthesis integral membrane protein MurJ [Gammaproteobacteria bacterium]
MTLISRVLGLLRDMVIAQLFGATAGSDAFFVAFKIPNFLRRLFAEGAFSQAFVPVVTEYKTKRVHEDVCGLIDRVSGTLGAVLVGVTVLGIVAAPLLIALFAPGFIGQVDKYDLSVAMLRITFPYLLFISLAAFAGAILNTYKQFGIPAFTPTLLNVSLILCAVFLAPKLENPITALAWGVFIGGVAQLLFQLPFLLRLRLMPRPKFEPDDAGVRKILRLMLPALFGVSVSQINLMVDTLIASFLVTGSVTWLYYSDRLVEFPLGAFGIALATVILPSLSEKHAQGSTETFSQTLDWALRWVIVIGAPASLGLMLLAGPMLTTLFQYREFSAYDVTMASRSLMAFSLGLLGFIFIKVLAPGFFARQDTRTPVRIGVIAMVANIVLSLLLVIPLAHAGLALSTSLSAFLNAGLLYRALRAQGAYRPMPGWTPLLLRVAIASGVLGAVLTAGVGEITTWLSWGVSARALHLALWIAVGAATYLISLWLAGLRWRDMTGQAPPV